MPRTRLFSPLRLRDVEFRNRVFVSPMCQYSCEGDGVPTDWHLVHLGARAAGGAGLVMAEATGVTPEGRISPGDTGLWNDVQTAGWARIARFIEEQGAVSGIQLAHAGRKASTAAPWIDNGRPLVPGEGGWSVIGPSALPFDDGYPVPAAMTEGDLDAVETAFVDATRRAVAAGFRVVEIHMAHGYLLHQFLSPISNRREDRWGGPAGPAGFENRVRFPLRVAAAVRAAWPAELPLFVRVSTTDWAEPAASGWNVPECVEFARRLKAAGVDLVDCSSGGSIPGAAIPVGPGYQVPGAAAVKAGADIQVAAVGMITEAAQAETILATGQADAVFLARELLRDPYWPLHAAHTLGDAAANPWPKQYERAKPRG